MSGSALLIGSEAWRRARGIGEPDPSRSRTYSKTPIGAADYCGRLLAQRPKAPAILALVVMGKVSPGVAADVRHQWSELDALYDELEAEAIERHDEYVVLMRNDLAHAQMREARRRRKVMVA